jgi:L-iditol 2-dehydrogenase
VRESAKAKFEALNKALFLHGSLDARVAPFNLREGRSDEILIGVAAMGICGSDLR